MDIQRNASTPIPKPSPTLLGYRPRRPWVPNDTFGVPGITAVASASNCIVDSVVSNDPEWDKINTAFQYPTMHEALEAAKRASAEPCEIHATLLYALIFEGKSITSVQIEIAPMSDNVPPTVTSPAKAEFLGFDVVSLSLDSQQRMSTSKILKYVTIDCAPLSCNYMGKEIPVNRWCLLDRWEDAHSAAVRFALEEPEPGPYVIVEILKVS